MYRHINKNIIIIWKWIILPCLAVYLLYSIYNQIINKPQAWEQLAQSIKQQGWLLPIIIVLLMPLNWLIEIIKWKNIIKPLHPVSFTNATKAVLSGIAISVNTPNRVGEFGGRLLYLPVGKRMQSIPISITASISQLLVTLVCGTVCLALAHFFNMLGNFYTQQNQAILKTILLYTSTLVTMVVALFYFRLPFLLSILQRLPFVKNHAYVFTQAEKLPTIILTKTFVLALLRYCTFVLQYILMLKLFGIQAPWQSLLLLTAIYYLIMAILPTITLLELGLRGQAALLVFDAFAQSQAAVIAATASIYILNLLFPALLGTFALLTAKPFTKHPTP
jgi:hypothetical protein